MRRILVVVDMQNDFIDGALGSEAAKAIVPNVVREIESTWYSKVIFTMDTHANNYLKTYEGTNLPIKHCIYPSTGWALNTEVAEAGDWLGGLSIYMKSGFGSPDLINQIVEWGRDVESVTFVGLCTDICVMTNAVMLRGALPDLPIYYVEDACAATTEEKQKAALAIFESCQIYPKRGDNNEDIKER